MKTLLTLALGVLISFSALAAPSRILVVGDSLSCGPFGKYLLQDLAKGGVPVTLYCAVSSAPIHWLEGKNPAGQKCQTMTSAHPVLQACGGTGRIPTFASLLASFRGERVVIALGTNSLLSPVVDATYARMAQMIRANQNACDWIGPPRMNPAQSRGFPAGRVATLDKNLTTFYPSLDRAVSPECLLIDSRAATMAGTAGNQTVDGVHRNDSAGKFWVQSIAAKLAN